MEKYIWLLWDAIAAVIFLHCVFKCASRGFVSTIVGLLVYIGATVAAVLFNKRISQYLYDNVVYDVVYHKLMHSFDSLLYQTGGSPKNLLNAIPFGLRMMLGNHKTQVSQMPLESTSELSRDIIEIALKEPIISIMHAVVFLLIFTLVAMVIRHLASLFTGVNKLPVIGPVNTVLGGVAGAVQGVLSLIFIGFLLKLAIHISGNVWWWLNTSVIQSTYIWRNFYL